LQSTPRGPSFFASKHGHAGFDTEFFGRAIRGNDDAVPRRPPPTQTGRPCNWGFMAISQLAKKLSPSTCRMRLGGFCIHGQTLIEPKFRPCQILAHRHGQKLSKPENNREYVLNANIVLRAGLPSK